MVVFINQALLEERIINIFCILKVKAAHPNVGATKNRHMKHIELFLIVMIFASCSNRNLILERGELDNDRYFNQSLGISISYNGDLINPWTTDSLNRVTPFYQFKKSSIDLNRKTEALLIGFLDNKKNTDIIFSVLNSDKVKLSKVKDYIISTNRERAEKDGVKLKITSSNKETININGNEYEHFSATYMSEVQDFTQHSKYAYKQHNDFILLIELPFTYRSGSSNVKKPDKQELISFLNSISFTTSR
jgi:hypothetical protein